MANELQAFLRGWDKDPIDGAALLCAASAAFPGVSHEELSAAVHAVARGAYSRASACAAAALCRFYGLGDPLESAFELRNTTGAVLAEPQWFLAIAGYSYQWICNSGLVACYLDFGDRQFADRIRVYEAIRAHSAVEVLREADLLFGSSGPPQMRAERQASLNDTVWNGLKALSPRFWACGDEIFTCAYLYALDHPQAFGGSRSAVC